MAKIIQILISTSESCEAKTAADHTKSFTQLTFVCLSASVLHLFEASKIKSQPCIEVDSISLSFCLTNILCCFSYKKSV